MSIISSKKSGIVKILSSKIAFIVLDLTILSIINYSFWIEVIIIRTSIDSNVNNFIKKKWDEMLTNNTTLYRLLYGMKRYRVVKITFDEASFWRSLLRWDDGIEGLMMWVKETLRVAGEPRKVRFSFLKERVFTFLSFLCHVEEHGGISCEFLEACLAVTIGVKGGFEASDGHGRML